jgi:C-terminal processing protease CtpA/Prc
MSKLCGVGMVLLDDKDLFLVDKVAEEGPAGRSGLVQAGDVLKGVGGVQVSIVSEFARWQPQRAHTPIQH